VKPNYQELTAATVLAFAVVIGLAIMPSRVTPLDIKHTIQHQAKKQARLPVEGASFVDRWNALEGIDRSKMPALEAWLLDHGVISNVIVSQGD
jgi:hypothetical protein